MIDNCPQPDLIDNSPLGLVDALVLRISKALAASWWHDNEFGEAHTPHVHTQFLPIRKASDIVRDESRDFPLVQVFHSAGKLESLDAAALTILILFGGWDNGENNQGWRIPVAMMWAVLQDLLADPFLGAYKLAVPIDWTVPFEGDPPYWDTTLTTTWVGATPARDVTGNLTDMWLEPQKGGLCHGL